jgi:hypothetical protein
MAKKLTAAQDSIPKQTYFSKTAKGNGLYKSGGDSYIEKMGKKSLIKKAKPDTVKIDSIKKVTPIGGSKPSFTIKKETTIKPAKPIAKKMPYKPAKKEIIKKLMK